MCTFLTTSKEPIQYILTGRSKRKLKHTLTHTHTYTPKYTTYCTTIVWVSCVYPLHTSPSQLVIFWGWVSHILGTRPCPDTTSPYKRASRRVIFRAQPKHVFIIRQSLSDSSDKVLTDIHSDLLPVASSCPRGVIALYYVMLLHSLHYIAWNHLPHLWV